MGRALARDDRCRANVNAMDDTLRFTVRYTDGGEGWVMAQVEQVPGAISQGQTRAEARENVIDALRLMLKPEPDEIGDPDRESLGLPLIAS
ncbi:MAG: type II toxin-antitoxin system HicB family antitoxin [Solirubrobacteraceae bacterium]